ncbi:NAD(P)H-dependent oxidoreductase [Jeotgalibaca sp. MA1X17-3]|nr:NAD(P)H-dependent oxidoreductase [Jeotgalibaca sp. MA1X17-3]UJF15732.1 NAD(P)H-dependent oxidoreductase [Jeotgalibaca sp. MA1X17-3]
MNVLMIKANDRNASESISSKMYETFLEEIQKNEEININTYDIFEEDMPYIGQDLFSAMGKLALGESLNEKETILMAAKQKAMDAFTNADVIVIAFPLWNLTIPARLQTFMDYVFSAGFTFKYDENGKMVQLMPEKKLFC